MIMEAKCHASESLYTWNKRWVKRHVFIDLPYTAHLQIPYSTYLTNFLYFERFSFRLDFEATLVRQVKQTNEAEACADFVHLLFGIGPLQP